MSDEPKLTTEDIGFAIRDAIESKTWSSFTRDAVEGLRETPNAFEVEFVDVSDPHNPIILTSTNQEFQIRIFAK